MLLCGIVNEISPLTKLRDEEATTLLSYFFCQATDRRLNHATNVLRGLIYLLINQQPSLVSHVRRIYDHGVERPFEGVNGWVALSTVFINILQDPSLKSTYLIVDALDECETDLPQLLTLVVETISTFPRIKWIVSSRNKPDIEARLKLSNAQMILSLELNSEHVSHAVELFIDYKVSKLPLIVDDNALQETVRRQISAKAGETFLWAALALKELGPVESWDVLDVLQEMPPELEPLYDRILRQVQKLQRKDPEFCRLVLSTMTLAHRPLHLLEVGPRSGLPEQISNNLDNITGVVRMCGSFLTIREEHVHFMHLSARDFLLQKKFGKVFPFDKAEVNEGLPASERDGSKESIEPRIKTHGHRGEFSDPRETATIMSRDSGYAIIISKQLLEGDPNELGMESIASVATHTTWASFLNPAGEGGAAEEFAEVLLDNEDIQQCVNRGFVVMDSDRFERNFSRLLKSYASELRAEADTYIQKGAARIVQHYSAYVTGIIRRRVLGLEENSQATAFHSIKDQTATKLALERFLAQQQPTETSDQMDTRPEDEQESDGDSHSDNEDPYLPNLEKLTDFLVSSTAFKNFKARLEAFVKANSQLQQQVLRGQGKYDAAKEVQNAADIKWQVTSRVSQLLFEN